MGIAIPKNAFQQELIFKEVQETKLVLSFLPPTTKRFEKAPVFVVISGGGWKVQSRKAILDMYQISCDLLRHAGFAVASADYRVTGDFPEIDVAQEVGDVLDALAYLQTYAGILQIDPKKLILTGHSAGGHIAGLISYADSGLFPTQYAVEALSVEGCVLFSAPCILYGDETWPDCNQKEFSNIYPDDCYQEDLAHQWSPYEYITANSPPTLFIHGDSDSLVPCSNSQKSYEKGNALGADFTLLRPKNGGHALETVKAHTPVSPSYEEVQKYLAHWVCQRLGIPLLMDSFSP